MTDSAPTVLAQTLCLVRVVEAHEVEGLTEAGWRLASYFLQDDVVPLPPQKYVNSYGDMTSVRDEPFPQALAKRAFFVLHYDPDAKLQEALLARDQAQREFHDMVRRMSDLEAEKLAVDKALAQKQEELLFVETDVAEWRVTAEKAMERANEAEARLRALRRVLGTARFDELLREGAQAEDA